MTELEINCVVGLMRDMAKWFAGYEGEDQARAAQTDDPLRRACLLGSASAWDAAAHKTGEMADLIQAVLSGDDMGAELDGANPARKLGQNLDTDPAEGC
jgi:hypothetical protein